MKNDCVPGADVARDAFNSELIKIGQDGRTLYERLLWRAAVVVNDLTNETPFSLLHRVIDQAYSRICKEAFQPDVNWEAYLTDQLGYKRADILAGRIDEHQNVLEDRDPWTIISRLGCTSLTDPKDIVDLFERRGRQHMGLCRAFSDSVARWTTEGLPGSQERAWGVLKKLVVEILHCLPGD
jgi:predicted transcriptional regulator